MKLSNQLEQLSQNANKIFPTDIKTLYMTSIEALKKTNIENNTLSTGNTAPNFTLSNVTGAPSHSLLYWLLSFYHGGWCPYCNLELKAYRDALSDIKSLHTNLIAKKFGLVFTLNNELIKNYKENGINLKESQGNDSNELPMPATYIIDTTGKIVLSSVNSNYTKRLDIDIVLNKLKDLN